MLITFVKVTELEGRKYLAGETREFNDEICRQLIESGNAVEAKPEEKRVESPFIKAIKSIKGKKK